MIFSVFGDMFFRYESGNAIHWLNTGTADIAQLTDGEAEFISRLGASAHNDWFMPELVERLHLAGKFLLPSHCYTYVTLPIFAEGKYEVSNINPVPAWQHFDVTGGVHRQLRDRPDGTEVRFIID